MKPKDSSIYLQKLIDLAHKNPASRLRLQGWQKVIQWKIDDDSFYWVIDRGEIHFSEPKETDFILQGSRETIKKIASQKLPFFLALWAAGELRFQGSYADANRLGYIYLNDKRQRQIVFLAHCFLNMNTRFPGGADFPGANVPLAELLLQSGVGMVQMPCPEFHCLGLEKTLYGTLPEKEVRACYRKLAEGVVEQMRSYLDLGYEISAILGMNPSPSCGVDVAKGRGTMLGLNRDSSEKKEPGLFIEEIKNLAQERGIGPLPFFGIRRTLPGETGLEKRLKELRNILPKKSKIERPSHRPAAR